MRVSELLVVTDCFLIATGATDRQVGAIVDAVEEALLQEARIKPIGREGERERRWVLLDYGDLVVHIFQPEEREFYRLEKLWSDAPRVALPGIEGATQAETGPAGGGEREEASP
jgi:ribosome-associated protein